jgi:hypothetical protein
MTTKEHLSKHDRDEIAAIRTLIRQGMGLPGGGAAGAETHGNEPAAPGTERRSRS